MKQSEATKPSESSRTITMRIETMEARPFVLVSAIHGGKLRSRQRRADGSGAMLDVELALGDADVIEVRMFETGAALEEYEKQPPFDDPGGGHVGGGTGTQR